MGWTATYKSPYETVRQFFEKQFNSTDGTRYIIDCAVVKRNTAYIAYKCGDGIVGLVCLINYNARSAYNFAYKDMDEDMGPGAAECPERILKLLTPTEHPWAIAWREKCWTNLQKRKDLTTKLKAGNILKLAAPIELTNGASIDIIKVINPKSTRFWCEQIYGNVRLPKRTLYNCTVIT